jgi:hypothetical protein
MRRSDAFLTLAARRYRGPRRQSTRRFGQAQVAVGQLPLFRRRQALPTRPTLLTVDLAGRADVCWRHSVLDFVPGRAKLPEGRLGIEWRLIFAEVPPLRPVRRHRPAQKLSALDGCGRPSPFRPLKPAATSTEETCSFVEAARRPLDICADTLVQLSERIVPGVQARLLQLGAEPPDELELTIHASVIDWSQRSLEPTTTGS